MITDFLKTTRSKEDLQIVLEVLQEFKNNESTEEWLMIPFEAWIKLEQLEEFLEYMVNEKPLKEDTIEYMNQNS